MFNYFSEKGMGLLSPPHLANDFSKKYFSYNALLLDDQILLSNHLHLRYWAICVLQLFVSQ